MENEIVTPAVVEEYNAALEEYAQAMTAALDARFADELAALDVSDDF